MIGAADFCAALSRHGVAFVTGVPCGWFRGPLELLGATPGRYLASANEGSAVACAAGAELAGRRAAVILQNSGLGNAVNPLASLTGPCQIPILLFISLRGWPTDSDDEPQHAIVGRTTISLLDGLGIRSRVLTGTAEDLNEAITDADLARAERRSYALLLPKGVLEVHPAPSRTDSGKLYRRTAIEAVLAHLDDAMVVGTTGRTARDLTSVADRPSHLPMMGSMGHALAIGLGAALAQPARKAVVLDGDGALLMHLGTAVNVGGAAPPNLLHVLLDNGCYDSTGGQPLPSVNWAELGRAAGYAQVRSAATVEGVVETLHDLEERRGPHLLVLTVAPGGPRPTSHPFDIYGPAERAERFITDTRRTRSAQPEQEELFHE